MTGISTRPDYSLPPPSPAAAMHQAQAQEPSVVRPYSVRCSVLKPASTVRLPVAVPILLL